MDVEVESKSLVALRKTGLGFLGGALLLALIYYGLVNRLTPVKQNLSLQGDQFTAVSFTPAIEGATYLINLNFDKAQRKSLNCQTIELSNIQWSLTQGNSLIQTGTLRDSTVNCREIETAVIFDISDLEPRLNQQHSLSFKIPNQPPDVKLNTDVSITPFGIAVHYAFMDLAIQELALGVLGIVLAIVGLSCFLPDLFRLLFRRKPRQ